MMPEADEAKARKCEAKTRPNNSCEAEGSLFAVP